jgi:tRNA dimethylallyltransferase
MSSIGYKQIGSFLRGEVSLETALEIFKRDTRRYAKKQLSWFKRDKRIIWVPKNNLRLVKKIIGKFLN